MTTDAPQAETSPNRRLSLESCTTRGTSSEKEKIYSREDSERASRAEKAEAEFKTVEKNSEPEPWPAWRPAEPWRDPSKEPRIGKLRQTPWTEESIRNMDASEKADTLPSRWCILLTKARNLILAATTASTSWYKQNGCNSRAKKEEPDRRLPFGAETAPSGPRRLSVWCGGKKPPRSRLAPQQEEKDGRLRKKDESARGATRGAMHLLVPPCGLLLTTA